MGKRRVPKQLRGKGFKKGSDRTQKAGASGGRKSKRGPAKPKK